MSKHRIFRMRKRMISALVVSCLTALSMLLPGLSASAATSSASVTVNAGTSLGTIGSEAFGLNTAVFDGYLLDSPVPGLLKQAGINVLRFPGGSLADVYHWKTNSLTPNGGGYANPNNTFDNFMSMTRSAGANAMITVNYGSNADGTGGGDPTEAADWVKYANITKGYGIKYWEIGNEIPGNGEYGAHWEEDLHADLSPTAYANNALTYIADMKAVDPTIKVGVVLNTPGSWPDGQSPDWNSTVLPIVGSKIDFVIVHWYAQPAGSESDSGLLASTGSISTMMSKVKSLINQYCGSNAPNVQTLITETNSVNGSTGKQTTSLVNGLFLADDMMTWLENGASNVDVWDLHNGIVTNGNNSSSLYGSNAYGDFGILSSGGSTGGVSEPPVETPFPSYYGMKMLSNLGKPGDTMVSASSNQSLVGVHAVKQANGNLAVMLENKDATNSYNVNVSIAGYSPTGTATKYFYGENSSSISSSQISGTGTSFIQSIPPYSLTTIVMTPNSSANPTFTSSVSASPSSVNVGQTSAIATTLTDTSGSISNGILDVEVHDASGNKVAQQIFSGQNLSSGQSVTQSFNWTAPSTSGNYTVTVGVFNSNWSTGYYWNNNAATIQVSSNPTFSDTTTVSPGTINQGQSSAISTTVHDTGGSLSNAIIDVEVHDSSGNKVGQQIFSGQNFSSGQSVTQSFNWTAPNTPGTYTVTVGVFNSNWSTGYYWDNNASTIKVN